MLDNVKVIKRDGKKVDFDGTKIALAIKKGFDSVNEEDSIYTENDVNKEFESKRLPSQLFCIKRIEIIFFDKNKIII